MTNIIDRQNHDDMTPSGAMSFLQAHNRDRDNIYAHLGALEESCEAAGRGILGDGTAPAGETLLIADLQSAGRATLQSGYTAIIGSAFMAPELTQAYTPGAVNYAFLNRASDGECSLQIRISNQPETGEILIASIDATGASAIVDMSPVGKPYASICTELLADESVTPAKIAPAAVALGNCANGSPAGKLDAVYISYATNATADAEDAIAHNLGRTPCAFAVCRIDKAGIVYDSGSAWDGQFIKLKCSAPSANVTLAVW